MGKSFIIGAVILFAVIGITAGAQSSVDDAGTICLAPIAMDAAAADSETGNRRGYSSYEFSVRVDKGEWTTVSTQEPQLISGLTVNDKHLVSIRDGEKLIESFWFRFDRYGTEDLCLWYKPWYQTWSLWDASQGGSKCRCRQPG